MKNIVMLCVFLLSLKVTAQISVDFEKYYGNTSNDYSTEIKQTLDGGYISVGQTTSNGYDFYVIKTNAAGDTSWTKTFGGIDEDWGYSVEQTSDGGYAVFGWTESYGTGGFPDFYLIKLDADGNTLWAKTMADGGAEYGYTIHQTSDNGFAMVGSQCTYGPCNYNAFFVKTDENGDTLWVKVYGGGQDESALDFIQTSDGGYAIGGYTRSYGTGGKDCYFIKTDAVGDTLWTKTYGNTNDDEIESIRQTNDNGYVLFGTTKSFGAGSDDYYLIKTDQNGDTLWTKTYGGSAGDKGKTVQQTTDGGYILIGQSASYAPMASAIYLIRTNSLGDTLWTKVFPAKEVSYGRYVEQTSDGGYILSGTTFSMMAFQNDVVLIKLSDSTSCVQSDSVFNITTCDSYMWNGNTYTTSGTYMDTIPNTLNCDSIMTLNLTINSSNSSIQTITACDSYFWNGNTYIISGNYMDTISNAAGCDSIMTLNLTINTVDTSIIISDDSLIANATTATYQWLYCDNNFITISGASDQIYIPIVSGNYAVDITQNGCNDTSFCYNIDITGIDNNNSVDQFFVYPNPVRGLFTIEYSTGKNIPYQITDITGKIIDAGMFINKMTILDLSEYERGTYLLRIEELTIKLERE